MSSKFRTDRALRITRHALQSLSESRPSVAANIPYKWRNTEIQIRGNASNFSATIRRLG